MAIFVCSKCDAQYPKWQGRCNECQTWGAIKESVVKKVGKGKVEASALPLEEIQSLGKITPTENTRISSGSQEIDKVLGGGLVIGSLALIGGNPGIGKSTLVLQIADSLVNNQKSVFYFSGEESGEQIKLRAERLKLKANNLKCSVVTNLDSIIATLIKNKPTLAIIDSIQTVWTEDAEGSAGGISQVRACTTKLLEAAKQHGITVFIIGHVTKEGSVAGPKTLEHLVDVVLYLEGEKLESIRLARVVKNRFGPSGEVGVLEMTEKGLQPVQNSGRIFLRKQEKIAGTSVGALIEGSRVFLTEVEALVEKSLSPYPKRTVIGFDNQRLQVLLAILHRHAKTNLSPYDVYVHLPGGLKSKNPSLDLGICLALASAKNNIALNTDWVAVGEVGLNGRLRSVSGIAKIIQEASNLGFKKIIIPKGEKRVVSKKIEVLEFENITEVIKNLVPGK